MDKGAAGGSPAQDIPKAESFKIPMMDAKRMSFDNASGTPYEIKSSPPLSSFFGRSNIKVEGDPLASMASAYSTTRRDSLKGMANLQDFSTD